MSSRFRPAVFAVVLVAAFTPTRGQEEGPGVGAADEPPPAPRRLRLSAEVKAHFRHSDAVEVRDEFPFPPPFLPPGEDAVFLRTPDAGSSLEVSTLGLIGEATLAERLTGRLEVHVLDLYNRNPTDTDDRIQLREAWLRFGSRPDVDEPVPTGHSCYVQTGKAPRFSRQRVRRLESYGLWGTAVARFEEIGVELGGTVGPHLYWRAQAVSGNPLFMRDPNALAGDNGTPQRQPGNVRPVYQSGFPILYDAKAADVDVDGKLQVGAGIGWRRVDAERQFVDVLGWYFRRTLADTVALPGTTYSGDIQLLEGPFDFFPLPIAGDEKREWGVNVEARHGAWLLFGQYVDQEIAGLPRSGAEVEVAWRHELPGLLMGETPIFRWLQPTLRVSFIENDFTPPREYPNPAVAWDWRKYDLGLRLGILPGTDLAVEYARNEMQVDAGTLHPDEWLVTLRSVFD